MEWSGAIAPNAAIVFAYSPNALTTSLRYLVNQGGASVQAIGISFGDCEADFSSQIAAVESTLAQAYTQGQSVFAASGDNGATDCDGTAQNPVTTSTQGLAVDYPASSIYVTAMGGTEFTGDSAATVSAGVAAADQYWNGSSDPNDTSASAFSYIPETTWNDTATTGTNVGTGGGVSKQFSKPSWQIGKGVPADGRRDVPDVSLASSPNHDGYIICAQSECQTGYRRNSDQTFTVIGGTSAAAPIFAGIAALINQKLGSRQGSLNPQIYSLAANSPWAFNDITSGDNKVVCTVGTTDCSSSPIGFSAGAGYDLVTGWGSVDATALLDALNGTPNPHFLILPTSRNESILISSNSGIGISVTPKEGFAGSVALGCAYSSSLSGATCVFENGLNHTNVTTPGSDIILIAAGSVKGAATGTLTVTGTSGSLTDSVVINVTITNPDVRISSGNTTETVSTGGSTTDTITVTPVQGFTGNVDLTCSGTTGLTCSLSPNAVTVRGTSAVTSMLTVKASSTAVIGSITITADFASGSTHRLQIPVTVTTVPPDFTLAIASPVVSIPSGGTITDNLTVASVGGFSSDVTLTCSVPSSLGTTACTITPVTVKGGSGMALVTMNGAVVGINQGSPLPFLRRSLGADATLVFALGMVFPGRPARRQAKRTLRNVFLGLLLSVLMFGAISCGGGGGSGPSGSNPTPLNGNVTITATSGSVAHTVTINVTVL